MEDLFWLAVQGGAVYHGGKGMVAGLAWSVAVWNVRQPPVTWHGARSREVEEKCEPRLTHFLPQVPSY